MLVRLGAVALGLAPFVALELVLRLGPWDLPDRATWNREHGLLGIDEVSEPLRRLFVQEGPWCSTLPSLSEGRRGDDRLIEAQQFRCVAREGRTRILALGGSSTQGYGAPDGEGWPRVLERLLRERGHDVEVINAGVGGHDSVQVRQLAERLAGWIDADIQVLYAGHNDFVNFQVADAAELAGPGLRVARRLTDALHVGRLGHLAWRRWDPPDVERSSWRNPGGHGGDWNVRPVPESVEARAAEVAAEEHARQVLEARFRESAQRIARLGPELVVVAPVSRGVDPPGDSLHWRVLDDEQLAAFDALIDDARRGERDAIRRALELDDSYAHLRWLAGRQALSARRGREAVEHLLAAHELVPVTGATWAPRSFRDVVEAAADDVDAAYLDPWPAFEAGSVPPGMPGEPLMGDSVHPSSEGYALLAELIAEAVEPLLPAPGS